MIGNSKSEGKYLLRKILVNICFGKVTDPQPTTLSKKMNPITGTFQAICLHLRNPCFKVHLKKKVVKLKFNVYIMFFFICSSFSAVAVCTFDQPMVSFLRTQRRIVWLTAFAFDWDQWRRKGNMEITEWKYIVESVMHGTWRFIRYCTFNILHFIFSAINPHVARI